MKTLIIFLFTLVSSLSFANSHIIVKQNGEKIEANYITTRNNLVYYTISGNSVEQEISVFAVEKIVDKTNNQAIVTNSKIDVSGKWGYKNVVVLNANQSKGLKVAEEFTANIQKVKGQSPSTWVEWTENRIKKEVAAKGYAYIQIVQQTDSKIKAIAYTY